ILTRATYNEKASLAVGCPVTARRKGYPFEVPLAGRRATGVVLADQIKSIDWQARDAKLIERVSPAVLAWVRRLIATLLEL
ncbi:MAG: type II toxin-antitoxin system PemK/MazF family toxin, partial [Candidatus Eremiobacteraeota bacterium]|nr:type II toxin-antitoxin system PemK/MazF family toxin [Candidatus Eremiobacteraeota bacterium]